MSTDYEVFGTVRTLKSFIEKIEQTYSDWVEGPDPSDAYSVWFRGTENDYSIVPSVFRPIGGKKFNEFSIFNSFRAIYKNYTTERFEEHEDAFFSFMQHYGVPTRLVDWTESYLVALYFAVENPKKDDHPVVWVLNSGRLNSLSLRADIRGPLVTPSPFLKARLDLIGYVENETLQEDRYFKLSERYQKFYRGELIQYPIAFHPQSAGNNRIINQKGMFTIHGLLRSGIETFFKETDRMKLLRKIAIQPSAATEIRESLRRAGISPRTVYPDLFGLAKELRTEFYWS